MFSSITALLSFTGWSLLLLFGVVTFRVAQVLAGTKKSNEFPAWIQHGSDFYWRLHRAHQNCMESLPVFAVIVLTAFYLGFQDPIFEILARVVAGARILQSVAHLSGGGEWNVNVRFTGFLIQFASFVAMLVILLRSLL
ncbi:MAPEG family protein [Leptospira wolffii]|uniref:MAPEG family protein n=1 Tax=Leptospira wolffii TaxID=409998 RepID=A0ABV5BU25_9LEPT